MAEFARKTLQVQDDEGNLILDPTARVRRYANGMPKQTIYSDRAGLNQLQNPATFSDGIITFCAEGGVYEIYITAASRPGWEKTLDEVQIGTLAEMDLGANGLLEVEWDEVVPLIANRETYDSQLKGFSVLVESDSGHDNLPTVYYKRSDTGGQLLGTLGTAIGNLTTVGGLAAAFDGVTAQTAAAAAALGNSSADGTIGKDWGSGVLKVVQKAVLYGPSNSAISLNTANAAASVNAKFQGSLNGSSWTDLDTKATGTASSAIITFTTTSTTAYRYHRILIPAADSSSDKYVAELVFFERGDWSGGFVFPAVRYKAGLTVQIDGQDSVIQTGICHNQPVPFPCDIVAGRITANGVGSIVIDIKKSTFANWPTMSSICAGNPLTISAARKVEDTALSGWTKTLNEGEQLAIDVLSCSGITEATLTLFLRRR
jgi:hypothetical protein